MWSQCTQKTMSMGLMVTAWGNKQASIKIQESLLLHHLLPSRLYCRLWNHTRSCPKHRLAGLRNCLSFTAGRELHPAPKIVRYNVYKYIIQGERTFLNKNLLKLRYIMITLSKIILKTPYPLGQRA